MKTSGEMNRLPAANHVILSLSHETGKEYGARVKDEKGLEAALTKCKRSSRLSGYRLNIPQYFVPKSQGICMGSGESKIQ